MTNNELADKLFQVYSCLITECNLDCGSCDYEFSKPSDILTTILDARAVLMDMSWIPVTETLPPADEWVLVTVENMLGQSWVERATYSHKKNSWSDGKFGINGVTAWMKMPDPYQEDDDGLSIH